MRGRDPLLHTTDMTVALQRKSEEQGWVRYIEGETLIHLGMTWQ